MCNKVGLGKDLGVPIEKGGFDDFLMFEMWIKIFFVSYKRKEIRDYMLKLCLKRTMLLKRTDLHYLLHDNDKMSI